MATGFRPGMSAGGSVNVARDDKAAERAARKRIAAQVGRSRPAAKKPGGATKAPSAAPRARGRAVAAPPARLRTRTRAENQAADRNARRFRESPQGRRTEQRVQSAAEQEWNSIGASAAPSSGRVRGGAGLGAASGSARVGRVPGATRINQMLERVQAGGKLSAREQAELGVALRAEYGAQQTGRRDLERVKRLPGLAAITTPGVGGVTPLSGVQLVRGQAPGAQSYGNAAEPLGTKILQGLDALDRPNFAAGQIAQGDFGQAAREIYGRGSSRRKEYLSSVVGRKVGYVSDTPVGRFLQDIVVDAGPGLTIPSIARGGERGIRRAAIAASKREANATRQYVRRGEVVAARLPGGAAAEARVAGRTKAARQARVSAAVRRSGARLGPDIQPRPGAPVVRVSGAGRGRPAAPVPGRVRRLPANPPRKVGQGGSALPYVPGVLRRRAEVAAGREGQERAAMAGARRARRVYVQTGRSQMAEAVAERVSRAEARAVAVARGRVAGAERRAASTEAANAGRVESGQARVREAVGSARVKVGAAQDTAVRVQRDLAPTRASLPAPRANYKVRPTTASSLRRREARELRSLEERAKAIDEKLLGRNKSGHFTGDLVALAKERKAQVEAQAQREGAGDVIGFEFKDKKDVGYSGGAGDQRFGSAGGMQFNPRRSRNELTRVRVVDPVTGKVKGSRPKNVGDYAREIIDELEQAREQGVKLSPREEDILRRADEAGALRGQANELRQRTQGDAIGGEGVAARVRAANDMSGRRGGMRGRREANSRAKGGVGPVPRVAQPRATSPRAKARMRSMFGTPEGTLRQQRDEARSVAEKAIRAAEREQERLARTVEANLGRASRAAEGVGAARRVAEARAGKAGRRIDAARGVAAREAVPAGQRPPSPAQLRGVIQRAERARVALRRAQDAMYDAAEARLRGLGQPDVAANGKPFAGNDAFSQFLGGPALRYLDAKAAAGMDANVGIYLNIPLSRERLAIPLVLPKGMSRKLRAGVGSLRLGPSKDKGIALSQLHEWARYFLVTQYGPNKVAGGLARYAEDFYAANHTRSLDAVHDLVKKHDVWDPKDRRLAAAFLEGTVEADQVPENVKAFARAGEEMQKRLFSEAQNAGIPLRALQTAYVYHFVKDRKQFDDVIKLLPERGVTLGSRPSFTQKREWLTIQEARDAGVELEDDLAQILAARASAHYRAVSDKVLADTLVRRFGVKDGSGKRVTGPWFDHDRLPDDVVEVLERIQSKREAIMGPDKFGGVVRAARRFNMVWKKLALLYPGYDFRNQFGDLLLLGQQGKNPFGFLVELGAVIGKRDRFDGFLSRTEYRDLAQNLGVQQRSLASGDFYRLDVADLPVGTSLVARGDRLIQRVRNARETLNRRGAMSGEIRRGHGPLYAADEANRVLFDYADVGRAVDAARRSGVSPFGTWAAKNLPRQLSSAVQRPRTLYNLQQVNRNAAEEDPRFDVRALPEYVRDKFPLVIPGLGAFQWGNPAADLRTFDVSRGQEAIIGDLAENLGPLGEVGVGLASNATKFGKFTDDRPMTGTEFGLSRIAPFIQGDHPTYRTGPDGQPEAVPTTKWWVSELMKLAPPLSRVNQALPAPVMRDGRDQLRGRTAGEVARSQLSFGAGLSLTPSGDRQTVKRAIGSRKAEILKLQDKIRRYSKAEGIGGGSPGPSAEDRAKMELLQRELQALTELYRRIGGR